MNRDACCVDRWIVGCGGYVKNKAYMAGQTPFFGDFPATGRTLARKRWPRGRSAPPYVFFLLLLINDPPASGLRSEHASEELRCRRWGTHRWRARQADHACTIAKKKRVRPPSRLARPQKKGVQGRSGPSAYRRRFSNSRPKMRRKWVKRVGVLNTDLPALWPNIWRLSPSAGRPGGRPLRFIVFHIAKG